MFMPTIGLDMQIPAMDAVESKRVGILQGDDFDLAAIMHDMSVPERNNGKFFRTARPVCIHTTEPVSLEHIFNTASEYNQHNFSEEFWQEADKTYRSVSNEYELEEDEEFNFERCMQKGRTGQFEAHFLSNIHHILVSESTTHEIWSNFLEDARWNRVEDCETGDVDISLYGDRDDTTFTESDFSEQLYLPSDSQVEHWGLYNYNHEGDGFDMYSLWYRFKTSGGSIEEVPLIDYTGDRVSVLSSDPDFGSLQDNHITEDLAMALEDREVRDDLSRLDKRLVEAVQNIEVGERTQEILDSATVATPVKSSMVADNI